MAMLCVVINKYGVPDMVSTIYYLLGKRGWVFVVSLFLADNDSADNWREATMEEYYKWQQE